MLSRLQRVKVRQWFVAFGSVYGNSLARLLTSFGFGGLALGTFAVMLLIRWGVGYGEAANEMLVRFAEFYAGLTVLLGWACVNFVLAFAGAGQKIKRDGRWYDDHFIYNAPVLIGAVKTDPGTALTVTLPKLSKAPRNCRVRYHVEFAPNNKLWEAFLNTEAYHFEVPSLAHQPSRREWGLTGEFLMLKNKCVELTVRPVVENADAVIARVWMESWQIQ
ncbi:hypothetical protein [Hyphobacterium indicum]|uniref:hypothetical protein n=1 Tax=Hyphobacterium indicum TaxID=2162714 RepID=UPI000D651238|nr:hypothetical protein [Hyphobacterium indicum]